jgi:hypothetical protein
MKEIVRCTDLLYDLIKESNLKPQQEELSRASDSISTKIDLSRTEMKT